MEIGSQKLWKVHEPITETTSRNSVLEFLAGNMLKNILEITINISHFWVEFRIYSTVFWWCLIRVTVRTEMDPDTFPLLIVECLSPSSLFAWSLALHNSITCPLPSATPCISFQPYVPLCVKSNLTISKANLSSGRCDCGFQNFDPIPGDINGFLR